MTTNQNAPDASRSRGREIALNVGAVAGLICVLAAAASFLFGIKPLVFRSGSMSPDIPTGALALSQATEAADLAIGDVVSVLDPQGTRITHRIQEIASTDGTTSVLILKGDANQDADISPYTVTEVDRVFFSVPGLGYAVSWLSSPMAIFLGGGLVGAVMVLAFGPGAKRKGDNDSDDSGSGSGSAGPGAHERIEQPAAAAFEDAPTQQFTMPRFQLRRLVPARTAMVLGAVGLTALGATATGTSAAFTDSATAQSGAFTAAANMLPTAENFSCSTETKAGYAGARMRWTHKGAPFSYRIVVTYVSGTGGPAGPWTIDVPAKAAGTAEQVYLDKPVLGSHLVWKYDAKIYTVNPGGEVSVGWIGSKLNQTASNYVYCDGDIAPAAAARGGGPGIMSAPALEGAGAEVALAPTTTTSVTASASTTATATSTTSASATATTTTSAAVPTTTSSAAAPAPTTTTTVPPVTTTSTAPPAAPAPTVSGTPSDSGTYTVAVTGTTATITDTAGTQTFTGTVGKGAKTVWAKGSDTLWIVDGDKVSSVNAATGEQTTVDPNTASVPAEVAALVAE